MTSTAAPASTFLASSNADLALDAAVLLLAAGASLNLALGQGALLLLAVLLGWRWLQRDAALLKASHALAPVLWPAWGFVAACIMSSLTTHAPFPGWDEATRWRTLLAIPLGALAIGVRGELLARRALMVFAAGTAIHALVGLAQVFWDVTPGADLLHIPADKRHVEAPGRPDLRSALGLFYNRVRLSHVLAAGAAVGVGLTVLTRRWWWAVCSLITLAGLLATWGRAALLALLVSCGVAVVLLVLQSDVQRRRRRLVRAGGALLLVGVVLMLVPPVRERLLSAADIWQNVDRLFIWGRGVEMAVDHAPFGTGFGGYSVVRDAYYDRVDDGVQSRAMSHNLLLSLLAETGVLGLVAWLWMWWALAVGSARKGGQVAWIAALAAGTFHAATLAHDPLYQSECALAWALCGACMVAARRDADDGKVLVPAA